MNWLKNAAAVKLVTIPAKNIIVHLLILSIILGSLPKEYSLSVFSLLADIKATYGSVVAHNSSPYFTFSSFRIIHYFPSLFLLLNIIFSVTLDVYTFITFLNIAYLTCSISLDDEHNAIQVLVQYQS